MDREELKSKLTALFSHYNVDEVWVGSNCDIFDNFSCPEIYLISQEDTTQLKREIASLYEYCDSNGTYLCANVMDYIKTEAVDYFMSTAKQVYKGGEWL